MSSSLSSPYRAYLFVVRNLGIIIAFIVFFCGCYMTATELITSAKSKGEVLVFRRGHLPKTSIKGDDEEARGDANAALAADGSDAGSIKLQKQTAIFHWEDVCYDIKIKGEPRRLLDHVNGWVEPGTLTALMVCFQSFITLSILIISS